jgi:hypothetical protein
MNPCRFMRAPWIAALLAVLIGLGAASAVFAGLAFRLNLEKFQKLVGKVAPSFEDFERSKATCVCEDGDTDAVGYAGLLVHYTDSDGRLGVLCDVPSFASNGEPAFDEFCAYWIPLTK